MVLKHLGQIALLSMLLWSCSDDNGVYSDVGKGEIRASFKANCKVSPSVKALDDEIEAVKPEINDFTVNLAKSDGSYAKTWQVSEFPTNSKFSTGVYTMELFYGSFSDEGFEKPYYYGSAKFNVEDEEVATPVIEAVLGNSMVSITYTDAFKSYFTSYSTKVKTGSGAIIDYASSEIRPVYVKPGKVSFLLSLMKSNGVEMTFEPASIENAEARTHYRVTIDVNGGEVGDVVLSITFDDSTDVAPIEVLLNDELINAPAPVITPKGFENNTALNIIEGDATEASIAIVAQAGIKSVILNTSSAFLEGKGWSTEMDIMNATAEQKSLLNQCGLKVNGLWNNPDKIAFIDFSELIPNLHPVGNNSTHLFSIQVCDIYGRIAESAVTLVVNAPAVVFEMSEPQKSEAASQKASFKLRYNGKLDNISFKAKNDYGVYVDAPILSCVESSDGLYDVSVSIPDNATSTIVKGYYKGVEKSSVEVKIGMAFSLTANDYDIWATKAIIKVNGKTPSKVISNVKAVYVNGVEISSFSTDISNNTFIINGLQSGTQNAIKIVANDYNDEAIATINVATEAAMQVPNSDMESWTIETKTVSSKTYYNFLPYSSVNGTEGWWATNNQIGQNGTIALGIWWKGCFASSTSYTNDSHSGSRAAYIFTNGHGRHYSDTGEILYTDGSYAGSMFIGTFSYNESEYDGVPVQGHSFSSRPDTLTFWYKYAPYSSDTFKAWIAIRSGEEIIAQGTYSPEVSTTAVNSYKKATIPLNYSVTNKKATSICVQFLSSTKTSFSSSDFAKKTTINYPEVGEWVAHRGSELWIDDIVLTY